MSAEKHMPGPWRVVNPEHRANGDVHFWIQPVEGYSTGWVNDRYLAVSGIGRHADALLMAAAPELLDALKSAAEVIEDCDIGNPVLDKARAAIAKATGESA